MAAILSRGRWVDMEPWDGIPLAILYIGIPVITPVRVPGNNIIGGHSTSK